MYSHVTTIRAIAVAGLFVGLSATNAIGQYAVNWWTSDSGGGPCVSSGFALNATIGQADAGAAASGGPFALQAGFWAFILTPSTVHGDMNCDGVLNNFDIDPFVLAVVDQSAYQAAFPNCDILNGDMNNDSAFNNFDIDPFVECIVTGVCP